MPVFKDGRSVGVTANPEVGFTGPKKSVFPGARPGSVTRDPLREGDTNTTKPFFPSGRPASVTTDPLRDRDTAQTNNAAFGGERREGGSGVPGAADPEHDTAGDGVATTKPSAPTSVVGTGGNAQVSVAFAPGAVPGTRYTVTITPGGKTASGTSSPIVVTGLTNGTAYTAKVVGHNKHGDGAASAASASFTPA